MSISATGLAKYSKFFKSSQKSEFLCETDFLMLAINMKVYTLYKLIPLPLLGGPSPQRHLLPPLTSCSMLLGMNTEWHGHSKADRSALPWPDLAWLWQQ